MSTLHTPVSDLIPVMSYSNEALLWRFIDSRRLETTTETNYGDALDSYGRILDIPLTEASKEVIFSWYTHLNDDGKAASTILRYAACLRMLYRFHLESDLEIEEYEAEIRARRIFTKIPFKDLRAERKKSLEMRNNLILPMEFDALMNATKHPRLKALWAVLYESACRKGEIVGKKGLKIRDITFLKDYVECRVKGKTGERTIPLVRSVPYLRAWIQVHPYRNNPEAPLFCEGYKGKIKPIRPDSVNVSMTRICKVAGIRHLHPHMFRHTRLTDLAKAKPRVGEFQLKSFAGWTPNSMMAARYIRLAGRDHMGAILEADGVPVEKVREDRPITLMEMSNCPNCDGSIGRDMPYCPYCGYILDDAIGVGRTQGSQVVEETGLDKMHGRARIEALEQELRDLKRENQLCIEDMDQNYRKVLDALEKLG